MESSNYLKETATKDIYLTFSQNFQTRSFSENRRKIFLEACRFYTVILLLYRHDFIIDFFLVKVFTGKLFQRTFRDCKFVVLEKKGQFCNGF